jgi:CMP-N-acetylneuraminic acid synthetase
LANINANYSQKNVENYTEKFSRRQETNKSVQRSLFYLAVSTENTNQEFRIKYPILCFHMGKDRLSNEQERLSIAFSEFQATFVTDALQLTQLVLQCQVDHQQLYLITWEPIPAELKSFESKWVRVYCLNASLKQLRQNESSCDQLDATYFSTVEQLISKLYHDLGRFYSNAAEQVLKEEQDSETAKRLLVKSARCYELLAQTTKDIIERYQNSNG